MACDEGTNCPVCGGSIWRAIISGSDFRIEECLRACVGRTVPPPVLSGPDMPAKGSTECPQDGISGSFKFARHLLEIVKEHQPSGRLLDIGSGLGHLVRVALDMGYDAVGLDVSPDAVEFAGSALGVNLIQSSFPAYEFEAASFDVIIMKHVLEHFPEPSGAISEGVRILKPGGLLAVSAPDFGSLMRRVKGARWYGLQPSQHVWQLSMRSILELVRGAGLTPIVARRSNLEYPRGSRPFQKWLMLRFMLMIADLFGMGDNAIVLARK